MAAFEDKVRVVNEGADALEVDIEPWGGYHMLAPGKTLDVVGQGASRGRLQVTVLDKARIVSGWRGSTVRVYQDGKLLTHYTPAAP